MWPLEVLEDSTSFSFIKGSNRNVLNMVGHIYKDADQRHQHPAADADSTVTVNTYRKLIFFFKLFWMPQNLEKSEKCINQRFIFKS